MRIGLALSSLLLLRALPGFAQDRALPVIDMHVHAFPANDQGPPPVAMCTGGVLAPAHDPAGSWTDVWVGMIKEPPCVDPIWSPRSDAELLARMIEVLDRNNVIAVTSGPPDILSRWLEAAPERILAAHRFNLGRDAGISPDSLRRALATGRYVALAEVTNQYVGITPDDPAFEPYLEVAEDLDIPVGIHIGTGPPGAPYLAFPEYRARLHSPLTLEEALVRHPRLRVWIMHAGWPMLDDLLAVLWTHPQVYVDLGVIVFALPRAELYRYLRVIVEAGFGSRVMFGSDQMVWPETIERGIRTIEEAPFLSEQQKRDILYNNAARFLRLSEADRDRHFRQ
jgi:predicted TIM-barrel fold metal-dependent hydrolase